MIELERIIQIADLQYEILSVNPDIDRDAMIEWIENQTETSVVDCLRKVHRLCLEDKPMPWVH